MLDKGDDDFSLDESKSLNLSTSNNMGRAEYRDKDSVHFEFEPEKRKGMSVASKDVRNRGSEMIDMRNRNL